MTRTTWNKAILWHHTSTAGENRTVLWHHTSTQHYWEQYYTWRECGSTTEWHCKIISAWQQNTE